MSTITIDNIEKASAQFWGQMLGMTLDPCGETWARKEVERCIEPNHVAAYCDLSGVWEGRIEVRLTAGLAREATAAMVMQPVDAVDPNDVLDATKEIANMIAGTLKSALPRPCSMTVPSAGWEAGEFCVLPCTADTVTVFFQHGTGELMVRVWHRNAIVDAPQHELLAVCA